MTTHPVMARNVKIAPLGCIGASVSDIDLTRLDATTIDRLMEALLDHLVLFFRNQSLTPASLHRIASQLGSPTPYPFVEGLPSFPDIIEVIKEVDDTSNFGGVWHSDTAYLDKPAMGALLYAKEVPTVGGDTMFTNMHDVYKSLSPGLQAFLCRLSAVNDADNEAIAATRPTSVKKGLAAEHPVVRTHPETGKKLLYVNRAHTTRFSNMTAAESRPVLQYLFDQIERPEFSYRFQWEAGSVAFWDNRACQHYPINDYHGQRRRMLRVSLAGDCPF